MNKWWGLGALGPGGRTCGDWGPCGNIAIGEEKMNVQKEGLEAEEKLSKKRRMNVRKLR